MINSRQHKLNHKLLLRIVELTISTLIISLTIRPLLFDIHHYFLWVSGFDLIIVSSLYLIIRTQKFAKWEITIALVTAIFLLLPILALSGGVNSQIAYFLPLMPVMSALLGGRLESLVIGFLLVIIVLTFTYYSEHIIDLSDEIYTHEKSYSRGFWLIITVIFSMFFGRFFSQKHTELTDQLKDENLHDHLTGLLNRRGLELHFDKALESVSETSPLTLMLIDVDYFKKINDEHGHDVGDACLVEVASTLKESLRKNDIIARFGGEEFIIALPNTFKIEATVIAENIRQTISEGVYSSLKLPLTITLGLTETTQENDLILKVIKRADKALYRGKDKGRNRLEWSK
ncbi:GGDEF domain-containing protein [Marinomonas sp. 5E14-1]|uniref:GGDEF domain-containing protein n=1 Tax=Marinomonas sp. 5E14-1 TaxID=3153922 RepID=UPI003266B878